MLLSPAIIALYRHAAAEAVRFPEVGQAVFERGPAVVYDLVAAYLRRWHDQGALRVEDPRAARRSSSSRSARATSPCASTSAFRGRTRARCGTP